MGKPGLFAVLVVVALIAVLSMCGRQSAPATQYSAPAPTAEKTPSPPVFSDAWTTMWVGRCIIGALILLIIVVVVVLISHGIGI